MKNNYLCKRWGYYMSLLVVVGSLTFIHYSVRATAISYWQDLAEVQVNGTITDEANNPLPGVSIAVQGTTRGTISDADGRYSLQVPTFESVLVFSYVGYKRKEVTTGSSSQTIDVQLEEDTGLLQELVVTGYSKQKRENLTGSVATVSAEKLTDVTTPNVGNLLQGKVSGVNVTQNTGRPGALPTIRIRGRNSINSSAEPLWVVDGVIVAGVPTLNPQDIASVSVLKDASAAALYGSRGANGVVVVTTKAGESGTSTVNVSAKTGVSILTMGNFDVMNSNQLYDYYQGFGNPDAIPNWYTNDLLNTNTDWFKLGTQPALTQDYNLSFGGGNENMKVYMAGNYYNEEGTVKGYDYDRFTGRINLEYNVNSWLMLKPKIMASYTSVNDQQHELYDMYRNLPWDYPFNKEGQPINPYNPGVNWYSRDQNNYYYDLQWNYNTTSELQLMTNLDFQIDLTKDLSFISTNNVTYGNKDSLNYQDPQSISGEADQGRIANGENRRITRFTNQMLNYQKSFGNHQINALAAYEFNDYHYNNVFAQGKGVVPGTQVLNATSEAVQTQGTLNEYAFQSVLFNANYAFAERYSLQFSFRRDGASRFGLEKQYGNFYSIGGAWNIHNEAFFNASAFTYLRLKGSYGGLGNTPDAYYPQYETYRLDIMYNGRPAIFPNTLGNNNLTWEKTYETNLAIEAGLFDRLDIIVEAYNKNTTDLLHYVPLPDVSGFSGFWDNIGGVKNTGIEVSLGSDILKTDNLNWRLDVNLGANRNRITNLYEGSSQINGNKIIEVGENVDTWYMQQWVGVNPADGTPQWNIVDPETQEATLTSNYAQATLQKVGNATPDFYGGINSLMQYKGISLSANFGFSKGAQVYNAARETYDSDGAYPTYNQMNLQDGWSRWKAPGDQATHPQLIYGGNSNSHKPSSRFLEDASYLRLRNVRLGYALPTALLSQLPVKNLDIYLSSDNLFTLTKFSGLDPEAAINGNTNTLYPMPRRFLVGLNFSF